MNYNYETWGRAAVIAGLQYAVEVLQAQLDDIRAELAGSIAEPKRKTHYSPRPTRRGRPLGVKNSQGNSYWDSMTPEQRSAEIKRRIQVRHGKAASRGRRSPQGQVRKGTPEYRQKVADAQRRRWANLKPKDRQRMIANMTAAAQARAKANGAAQ